jgi:NADP-dependent 3-hydroxy acid dehydrogenase YdfG
MAGLPSEFKSIDVLVNNASLALNLEPAHKVPIDDWETMVDTNIKRLSLLHPTHPSWNGRKRSRSCREHQVGGSTVPFYPGGNVYGTTKAFVKQFSLNLRADLLGTPGRATDIKPGLADTEFSLVRFKGDNERAANLYKGMKLLTPEDTQRQFIGS